ncbi:hypothetical protein [Nonomuraea sp. NPDC050691]|uniref:hypothetical protein n=1 Tax=Nonomuraea sp. NPDC050691 TaxID=3155661 RepID=UPI0033FD2A3A
MTGPWRTPRGSATFTGVVGLVLLSLLMIGSLPAWHGGDPAHRPAAAGQTWVPGAGDGQLSSLPPQNASVREHHVLWLALRGERATEAAHVPLLPAPGLDSAAIRDPQQVGHRATGSRSPPLI